MVFAILSNIRRTKTLVSSISTLKTIDIFNIWIFFDPQNIFFDPIFFDPSPIIYKGLYFPGGDRRIFPSTVYCDCC